MAALLHWIVDPFAYALGLSAAIGALSRVVGLVVSYHANVAAGGTNVVFESREIRWLDSR